MYPYYRRPSRLLWFFFGGLAATLWLKHKEYRHPDRFGFCVRKPIPHTPAGPIAAPPPPTSPSSAPAPPSAETGRSPTPAQRAEWPPFGAAVQPPFGWEEEKERIFALGRQAGDAMTEMSETTLDTLLSAVEGLRAKLAAHRAEREAEKQRLEQLLAEEKQNAKRWV